MPAHSAWSHGPPPAKGPPAPAHQDPALATVTPPLEKDSGVALSPVPRQGRSKRDLEREGRNRVYKAAVAGMSAQEAQQFYFHMQSQRLAEREAKKVTAGIETAEAPADARPSPAERAARRVVEATPASGTEGGVAAGTAPTPVDRWWLAKKKPTRVVKLSDMMDVSQAAAPAQAVACAAVRSGEGLPAAKGPTAGGHYKPTPLKRQVIAARRGYWSSVLARLAQISLAVAVSPDDSAFVDALRHRLRDAAEVLGQEAGPAAGEAATTAMHRLSLAVGILSQLLETYRSIAPPRNGPRPMPASPHPPTDDPAPPATIPSASAQDDVYYDGDFVAAVQPTVPAGPDPEEALAAPAGFEDYYAYYQAYSADEPPEADAGAAVDWSAWAGAVPSPAGDDYYGGADLAYAAGQTGADTAPVEDVILEANTMTPEAPPTGDAGSNQPPPATPPTHAGVKIIKNKKTSAKEDAAVLRQTPPARPALKKAPSHAAEPIDIEKCRVAHRLFRDLRRALVGFDVRFLFSTTMTTMSPVTFPPATPPDVLQDVAAQRPPVAMCPTNAAKARRAPLPTLGRLGIGRNEVGATDRRTKGRNPQRIADEEALREVTYGDRTVPDALSPPPTTFVRDYVTNVLTDTLDDCVLTLVHKLCDIQLKARDKGALRKGGRQRFVCGLRETLVALAAGGVRAVILAPDIEKGEHSGPAASEGGVFFDALAKAFGARPTDESADECDEDAGALSAREKAASEVLQRVGLSPAALGLEGTIQTIIAACALQGEAHGHARVPVVFAMSRKRLAFAVRRPSVCVSVVAILSASGAEVELKALLAEHRRCQLAYAHAKTEEEPRLDAPP